MLDLVSYWLDMYMLELKLFHGKNEALIWLKKKFSKHKGSAVENFSQGTLGSFRKSVISWCRKVKIEF
mgnify:FL=1